MNRSPGVCLLHGKWRGILVMCDACHTTYCNLCEEELAGNQELNAWPFMYLDTTVGEQLICGFCMYGEL